MKLFKKGYRLDVFVKNNNQYYNLRVYDILRLQQEFKSGIDSRGYYSIDPNLVLVREVNKKEIVNTLKNLYDQKYFEEIKPVSDMNSGKLIEIQ